MNKIIKCGKYGEIDESIICEVLLSAYNGEKYIETQVESIIAQKGINVKLLIRDDGSTDNTLSVLTKIKDKYPEQVSIIKGENVGIHNSFAELLKYSGKYNYIAFADQDDYWDEDKLAIGIYAMISNNSNFYSSASRLVDDRLNPLDANIDETPKYAFYLLGNSKILTPGAQGCTIIINRDFADLLIETDYPDYYGHDTWITVVAYCLNKCLYDPIPHMSYRQHNQSWTGNRNKRVKQFLKEFRFFLSGMKRYKSLSNDLLQRYEGILSKQDKEIAHLLCDQNLTLAKKVQGLRKYHFGKYGFVQNALFLFFYLIMWESK